MKLKKLLTAIFCLAIIFALAGCNQMSNGEPNGTKVVFELEGGKYKNSPYAVRYTYSLKEGETTYIKPPEYFEPRKNPVERSGYKLVGWFKTKTGEGENAVYSDQWDFDSDSEEFKVGTEGITLYAKWEKIIQFTFTVGYLDGGTFVPVNRYENISEKNRYFEDYLNYADDRSGYSPVKKYDEDEDDWVVAYKDIEGNAWDFTTPHPLTEEEKDVKIVVDYVRGNDVEFVRNKEELVAAKNSSIYLVNDIDMGGDVLEFGKYSEYSNKYFYGNGHTVSNFKVLSKPADIFDNMQDGEADAIFVSVFGSLSKSTVENVTFKNFTVEISTANEDGIHNNTGENRVEKIYFAPLCVKAEKSTVTNVKVDGVTFVYGPKGLYTGFDEDEIYRQTVNAYYSKDNDTTFTGCTVSGVVDDTTSSN